MAGKKSGSILVSAPTPSREYEIRRNFLQGEFKEGMSWVMSRICRLQCRVKAFGKGEGTDSGWKVNRNLNFFSLYYFPPFYHPSKTNKNGNKREKMRWEKNG